MIESFKNSKTSKLTFDQIKQVFDLWNNESPEKLCYDTLVAHTKVI